VANAGNLTVALSAGIATRAVVLTPGTGLDLNFAPASLTGREGWAVDPCALNAGMHTTSIEANVPRRTDLCTFRAPADLSFFRAFQLLKAGTLGLCWCTDSLDSLGADSFACSGLEN